MKSRTSNFREIQILSGLGAAGGALENGTPVSLPQQIAYPNLLPLQSTAVEPSLTHQQRQNSRRGNRPILAEQRAPIRAITLELRTRQLFSPG
jgi:hypothetical protein